MSPFFSNVLFSDLVEKALSSLLGCPLSTLLNTHLFYHQSAACVCVCVCVWEVHLLPQPLLCPLRAGAPGPLLILASSAGAHPGSAPGLLPRGGLGRAGRVAGCRAGVGGEVCRPVPVARLQGRHGNGEKEASEALQQLGGGSKQPLTSVLDGLPVPLVFIGCVTASGSTEVSVLPPATRGRSTSSCVLPSALRWTQKRAFLLGSLASSASERTRSLRTPPQQRR